MGFGNTAQRIDGFLIYPEDVVGQVTSGLSLDNPWRVTSGHDRHLWFTSVNGNDAPAGAALSQSEKAIVSDIEMALGIIAKTQDESVKHTF